MEGFSLDNLIAVIPAAGAGKRLGLGINKAFAKINSVPLLVHCLTMLSRTKLIIRAIVVLAPDEVEEGRELLDSYQGAHFADLPFVVVAGGKERHAQSDICRHIQLPDADSWRFPHIEPCRF